VGGQENPDSGIRGTQSAKSSPPFKMYKPFSKYENPEDEENWEEDTTDTEIMKNINSLLDSDLFEPKNNIQKININIGSELQSSLFG